MKVAIVGTRTYPDLEQVRKYVRDLSPDDIIVSGPSCFILSSCFVLFTSFFIDFVN